MRLCEEGSQISYTACLRSEGRHVAFKITVPPQYRAQNAKQGCARLDLPRIMPFALAHSPRSRLLVAHVGGRACHRCRRWLRLPGAKDIGRSFLAMDGRVVLASTIRRSYLLQNLMTDCTCRVTQGRFVAACKVNPSYTFNFNLSRSYFKMGRSHLPIHSIVARTCLDIRDGSWLSWSAGGDRA